MKTEAGAGLLFISPLGKHMRYAVPLHFPTSNNMAEYEALLCGLRTAIETGIKCLDVRGDSQIVIDQVINNASCHDEKMEAYCNTVCVLEDKFYDIELNHIPASTTRRRTSSRRSRQGNSPFLRMFSRATSLNLPSTL
jgi:ribonuclease HI